MALAPRWKLFALRLLVLLAVPVFLAFTVNALRPHGLAFIATQPYEIFTDCPEATVQSDAVSLETARKRLADFALVDARPPEDAASSPLANTFSLPYDELFPRFAKRPGTAERQAGKASGTGGGKRRCQRQAVGRRPTQSGREGRTLFGCKCP